MSYEFLVLNYLRGFNSKFNTQNSKLSSKGSVLIVSLLSLSLFSIWVSHLAFQGAQHAFLMKREIESLKTKAEFISGLNLFNQKMMEDPEPHEDGLEDEWMGGGVEDEESKINLNTASEAFLLTFLKKERKDMMKQIVKAREKERISSIEELYLLEDIEKEDIETLRPFITVYPELGAVNINTAKPLVLESLIESLSGDDFAKEELFRKLGRNSFRSEELTPHMFLEKLKLGRTPSMIQLINQFLPLLTTDSKTFQIRLTSKSGKTATVVIREKGWKKRMEVLSWHEE